MAAPDYDPLYLSGIAHFNVCEFFEAHDEWEHLWTEYQGPGRNFYKGLIHVAVCLHHFGNSNIGGTRKLYHSSKKYLSEYLPKYEGIDLVKLLGEMDRCCAEVIASTEERPSIELDAELIPEIHLDPPPAES